MRLKQYLNEKAEMYIVRYKRKDVKGKVHDKQMKVKATSPEAAKAMVKRKAGKHYYDNISVKVVNESKVFNMQTFKKVEKSLKDQWDRVSNGKGAAAKFGSWILQVYKTEKDFLNAPIEVSDEINKRHENFPNLKKAVAAFPDLDDFMSGMRGNQNRIRFERNRRR